MCTYLVKELRRCKEFFGVHDNDVISSQKVPTISVIVTTQDYSILVDTVLKGFTKSHFV